MIKIEAFLALEASLANRLQASFQEYAKPLLAKIEAALASEDYDEATRLAGTINLYSVLEESRGYVSWVTNLAMLFGASRVTKRPGTSVVGLGYEKLMTQQAVANFCTNAAEAGTAFLTAQALQLIAQRRQPQVQKDSEASKKAWLSRRRAKQVNFAEDINELTSKGIEFHLTEDHWKQLGAKVGPLEFVTSLMGGIPDSGKVVVTGAPSLGKIELSATNTTVHGAKTKEYMRSVDLKTGEAHHDVWALDKSAQGSGAAKKGLAESIALYEKMGLKKITLLANKDAGGYVWARFGFTPDDAFAAAHVMTEAQDKLAKLTKKKPIPVDTPEAQAELKAVGTLLDKMLTPGSDVRKSVWLLSSMKTPNLDKVYGNLFRGNSTSIAKHMLRDTYWKGTLDLTDKEAVGRTKKYVGAA